MRIYIAGKVTGLLYEDVFAKFEKAEQMLLKAGWEPVNPMKLGIPFTASRDEALRICVPKMKTCKAIFMLEDWEDSIGSIVEHGISKHENRKRYYEQWHKFDYMKKINTTVL